MKIDKLAASVAILQNVPYIWLQNRDNRETEFVLGLFVRFSKPLCGVHSRWIALVKITVVNKNKGKYHPRLNWLADMPGSSFARQGGRSLIEPISAGTRTIRRFRATRIPLASIRNPDDSDGILTTSTRIPESSAFHQRSTRTAKPCSPTCNLQMALLIPSLSSRMRFTKATLQQCFSLWKSPNIVRRCKDTADSEILLPIAEIVNARFLSLGEGW